MSLKTSRLKASRVISWLLVNRQETTTALSALAREPLPSAERRLLQRLVAALELDGEGHGDPQDMAKLANRLSSREFTWLAQNSVEDKANGEPSVPTSRLVLSIAQAINKPSRLGLHFKLVYPLVLIALTWVVLVWLCFTAVPPFEAIFHDFGISSPLPTRLLVSFSQFLRSGAWLGIPLVVIFGLVGFLLVRNHVNLARIATGLGLRQRGNASDLLAMSRFASELAKAAAANLPLADALRWAASNCKHSRYEQAAVVLAAEVQRGATSLKQVTSATVFPANLFEALPADNDPAGHVNIPLLLTLADIYAERAAGRVESGATYLSVFAVIAATGSIAFAALALFLPLITLITALA